MAHRIGEILSLTNPDDWHWVPTKNNAADDVTKWGTATQMNQNSRWFRGPDFLYQAEEYWPEQSAGIEEELRASVLWHQIILPDSVLIRAEHISKWKVVVRTVATTYRFVSNCQRRFRKQPVEAVLSSKEAAVQIPAVIVPLRQEEYLAAENCLWRVAQGEEFADEVKTLVKN